MSTLESILRQMGQIQEMERGKLCPIRDGRYFNHQTWQGGRNVVRYVPAAMVPELQRRIAGYRRFMSLCQQYVDLIIRRTQQRHRQTPPARAAPSPRRRQAPKARKTRE